jgi:hypothetical protein
MEEAKQFGRALADRACSLIREEGGSAADIATLFCVEVAQRVRQMEAEGRSGDAIADWTEAADDAYRERLHELSAMPTKQ